MVPTVPEGLTEMEASMSCLSGCTSKDPIETPRQLVRERSSREAIQSALKNELVESKEQLAVEIHKLRQETKRAMDEAVGTLQLQMQTLTRQQADTMESKEPNCSVHSWPLELWRDSECVFRGFWGLYCLGSH